MHRSDLVTQFVNFGVQKSWKKGTVSTQRASKTHPMGSSLWGNWLPWLKGDGVGRLSRVLGENR